MASVRDLKRNINNMIYDVVDECFSIQLFDESKEEVTDAFIEDAADFQEEIMAAIGRAKSKKEYKAIEEKVEATHEEWLARLNKL
ncbi:MAG TPA: hypothetical protein VL021_10410 [Brumimicrobium sp.]|nr:hypothetical protein [Brumimicrobium sp.]